MRRKLVLGVGLLACLGLVALVVWSLLPPKPGVTEANFLRLHAGMSQQEVRRVFGGPGEFAGYMTFQHLQDWEGDHCHVTILFSDFGGSRATSGTLTTDEGQTLDLPAEPGL